MVTDVAAKAVPSWPRIACTAPRRRRRRRTTKLGQREQYALPVADPGPQDPGHDEDPGHRRRKPAGRRNAPGRAPVRGARIARNCAPCSRHSTVSVRPRAGRTGAAGPEVPVNSPLASIGRPVQQVGQATPSSSGSAGCRRPASRVQVRRHARPVGVAAELERHPAQDERRPAAAPAAGTGRRTSWRTSPGTRRTWPPPADDQPHLVAVPDGPIVPIATRGPSSSRPTTPCSMPTPKSKPSSTMKPVHSTAMTMNQKSQPSGPPQ